MRNTLTEDLLIQWNLRFRYDRKWRKKYNIPFGSKEHLESNQIDVFLDLREDKLFEQMEQEYLELKENETDYKKTGKFLKKRKMSLKDEDELYKKIKASL